MTINIEMLGVSDNRADLRTLNKTDLVKRGEELSAAVSSLTTLLAETTREIQRRVLGGDPVGHVLAYALTDIDSIWNTEHYGTFVRFVDGALYNSRREQRFGM